MAQYRMMIVDDEQATRQGLLSLPLWGKLGIMPVAEADDGDTALARIDEAAPDILLTDVKMPRMDGITLAREALLLLPALKVLFISGYDDVEYVRSALKMGACDYICKPIDLGELEASVSHIVEEIARQRALDDRLRTLQERGRYAGSALRQQQLRDLLKPDTGARAAADMRLRCAHYVALCIQLDDWNEALAMLGSEALLEFSMQNIAEELLDEACAQAIVGVVQSPSRYVALVGMDEAMPLAELTALAARLRETIGQYLRVGISVGIGCRVSSPEAFHTSYEAAAGALLHRLHLGKNQVIAHDSPLIAPAEGPDSSPVDVRMEQLFLEPDDAALRGFLRARLDHWIAQRRTDPAYYQAQAVHLVYGMHAVLQSQVGEDDEQLLAQPVIEQLYRKETLEEMHALLWAYASEIYTVIGMKNDAGTSALIASAKAFIEEAYAQNLSIQDIAQRVYISPTYLCLLFRQRTGMTVNAYLTQVRMERAKGLLRDLGNKLYDVSFAVGYSNPSYFSRQFKKHTGLLPSDWRNQNAGKGGA